MAWTEADFDRMMGRGVVHVVQQSPVWKKQEESLQLAPVREISLILPMAPSMNHYWRYMIAGHGSRLHAKVIISRDGRQYRREAVGEILRQWPADMPRPLTGRLRVTLRLTPKDKRVFDIDNRIKVTLDVLQRAGVYGNDSQVDMLSVCRSTKGAKGMMVVTIGQIPDGCDL